MMKKISLMFSFITLMAFALYAKPLKVYILVGQSNMQGHGKLSTVPYMQYDGQTKPLYKKILDENGKPRTYKDVQIVAYSEAGKGVNKVKHGPLTMGYGSNLTRDEVCGPELAFGITMQELLGEPVLLIKTSWGGKSLNTDFRSPSAGQYKLNPKTQAIWDKHPNGAHGVPKKPEREEWFNKKNKITGHYYRLMVKHVHETLANIEKYHPAYNKNEGYELAGLVWFQGWNDMCDGTTYPESRKPGAYAEYTDLIAHFIRDVRKEFKAPEMKIVIGVIGVNGEKDNGSIANMRPAMAAPASMKEFKGNVAAVQTSQFWDYPMANLEKKKVKVKHRLEAGHVIAKNGLMEPREDKVPGWELIGTPNTKERIWKVKAIKNLEKQDQIKRKEKKRYREIRLSPELKDWFKPEYDDSKWESGHAPIGKGVWKFRDYPTVKYNTDWGDGEFLLMRTSFNVDKLDYEKFRISVLTQQGFKLYLNGQKIHTYIWWRDDPHYRAIELEKRFSKLLKKGKNHLAVYANCEYSVKNWKQFGAVDVMIEGITKDSLKYVSSEENKARLMAKVCSEEEAKIVKGMSNGGYHYLGSAKMLSQIGEAFAKAMNGM